MNVKMPMDTKNTDEELANNKNSLRGSKAPTLAILLIVTFLIVLLKGLFLDNGFGYKAGGLISLLASLFVDFTYFAVPFCVGLVFCWVSKKDDVLRSSLFFGIIVGFLMFAIAGYGGWYGHCRTSGNSSSQCGL